MSCCRAMRRRVLTELQRCVVLLASLVPATAVRAEVPAFPGAMGFGATATGGRGGPIVKVANLNARGPGSLQAAIDQAGPRIVVFEVSGVISAPELRIDHGDLTIAGQTAPGAGITLNGRLVANYGAGVSNLVIRHLRVRAPAYDGSVAGNQYDAVQFSTVSRVMLDHVTVSHGVDETVDFWRARDVTIQNSSIESSQTRGHPEGVHNYALIAGPDSTRISVLRNLFAHHRARTPALATGPAETVNNLIYNVRDAWVHHNQANGPFIIEGNSYVQGGDAEMKPALLDAGRANPSIRYFYSDNRFDRGNGFEPIDDPVSLNAFVCAYFRDGDCRDYFVSERPAFTITHPARVLPASEARELVLDEAGAWPRDPFSEQVIAEVRTRTGRWGSPVTALLGDLVPGAALRDTDGDGLPDDWERREGLDPQTFTDVAELRADGYSLAEHYVNEQAMRLREIDSARPRSRPNRRCCCKNR